MQTLLVVEDSPAVREGLAIALRREGYHVVHVSDGEQALQYLRTGAAPDLILLDMLMPLLDGWGFLEQLHKGGWAVPVVVMTAIDLRQDWAQGHGCQGFLKKPVEGDELLAEVRRCLPPPARPLPG
jgi:two-component system, OmpR family, response regulator MprA